jgi:hypothetical protein
MQRKGTASDASGAATKPMPDQLVFRRAGRRAFSNLDQMTACKQANGLLYGGFRETAGFGELAETHPGAAFAGAKQSGPEHEIDKKGRCGAIVPDQIGHENVQHILVDGDMVHCTIVRYSIADLQRH